MAGHSHWSNVKRTKEASSQKRALLFSKLSRKISLFAKEEKDPKKNPSLRIAIEEARKMNMPKDNIEKAIKKGAGEIKGELLEGFLFEVFGPENLTFIIEGITDNIKRTLSDLKVILSRFNGKLAEGGSIRWNFDQKGLIIIEFEEKNKDNIELFIIESGAENFIDCEDYFEVYTKPEDMEKIKLFFQDSEIEIVESQLVWIPRETVEIEKLEKYNEFIDALEESEDIQQIFSNIKL